jgi:hypothetical protein
VNLARYPSRMIEDERKEATSPDAHGAAVVAERDLVLNSFVMHSIAFEIAANTIAAQGTAHPGDYDDPTTDDREFARRLLVDAFQVAAGGPTLRSAIDRVHRLRRSEPQDSFEFRSVIGVLRGLAPLRFEKAALKAVFVRVRTALRLMAMLSPERREQLLSVSQTDLRSRIEQIARRVFAKISKEQRGRPIGERATAELIFAELGWEAPSRKR